MEIDMKIRTRPLAVGAFIASMALTSPALYATEKPTEELSAEDRDSPADPISVRTEVIAALSLGRGQDATKLEIVAIPGVSGDYSFGILEENRGQMGLDDFPTLKRSGNPRELFNAFAKEGELEPALLMERFDAPSLGKAGWANEVVERMPKVDSASRAVCNWNNFKNSFNSYRPDINGTKRWYTSVNGDHDTAGGDFWTHPWAHTWWLNYAANTRLYPWNNQYHNYGFYNIDKYKTKVKVCILKSGNAYQDRYVAFRFRRENNSAGVAYYKELTPSHVGTTFSWNWPASSSSSQKNYDWVTLVGGATVHPHSHPNDKFYVAVQKK
jgi:hypothetical protein